MNGNIINQPQNIVQENGRNSWTMNGSLDNNRNLQHILNQEEAERNDERIMNLYKKAAKNTEENFRKLLKESREGTAPTFLLPPETGVFRPTSTFGSRDELKNIVKECLREILNENNQEMPSCSQKGPPQNLSNTDVNVVVPQQQNGSQQHQPLPSISTMFDGRRSMAATPINEIERQQIALSRTSTPMPLRFQQPTLRLQTRMPFSSPTSLLPPIPPVPPTLQSPIFRAQSSNCGGSNNQDTAARANQSQVPACCRYPPPLPPGFSLEQYHGYLFLQAQRNRFPFPQPPPTPTPTPTTKSNTISENLQTAANNPYLQQFPRFPLDQNEHERLNQMFYANVLRPPTMQPPNSMHSQPPQQQPQQQLPSTPTPAPTPTKRTRKRKRSPEKCLSVLSTPSDISQQQNIQFSTFPVTANVRQQINNGPMLSSAAESFQPQESEERLINVIQNPNVTTEENNNNNENENENADHDNDNDDIIIIEHNQDQPNPACIRTPETPPPKLCIADGEEEEDENEEPSPSKIRALTFSKSAVPLSNLSTSPAITTSPLTTSSPSTSEASPSPDITFISETVKELCEAHFSDKPMLKGYYKILQEKRPQHLPKYLNTIGFAHNLQDSKKTIENIFEFGKSNAAKLLAQAKQDPPKCSKCREMDVPLPETLISYLEEVEKCSNNSDEMTKHALLKVIKFTCDALSNAMEKIFNSTKFYIGTPNPPSITKELRNSIESAFKSADNYEKCSIIWNSEQLKNIKIGVAEEFYRLKILSDTEKNTIVKHCECEHEWIYKRPSTRRGRRLIDYD